MALGICFQRKELGTISEAFPICERYVARPGAPQWRPTRAVRGRAPVVRDDTEIEVAGRPARAPPRFIDFGGDVDSDAVKELFRQVLREEAGYGETHIHPRFEGGTLVLRPRDTGLSSKEVSIETFFHKIVMLRDRLRVLEAKLNAHEGLSANDKVEFQQYVSRCYGTLTTFNILFSDESEKFSSS